jgi:hypothetical protein
MQRWKHYLKLNSSEINLSHTSVLVPVNLC